MKCGDATPYGRESVISSEGISLLVLSVTSPPQSQDDGYHTRCSETGLSCFCYRNAGVAMFVCLQVVDRWHFSLSLLLSDHIDMCGILGKAVFSVPLVGVNH